MPPKKKKSKTNPALSVAAPKESATRRIDARILSAGCGIGFFFFLYWFIVIVNRDYFYVVQEYNLFLNNRTFFFSYFNHVGGPLRYVSCFLTQYFDSKAILVLIILLFIVQRLTEKLFRLEGGLIALSYLPPFLLLALFTQVGYRVFDEIICLDYLCGCILGTLTALLFVGGYVRIAPKNVRFAYAALGTAILYDAEGIFGLFGLALCITLESRFPQDAQQNLRREILFLVGLLVPVLFYQVNPTIPFLRAYVAGLPEFFAWKSFYAMSALLFAVILCLAFCRRKQTSGKPDSAAKMISYKTVAVNTVIFLSAISATIYFSHANREFLVTVKMCKLMDEHDWEGILRIPFSDPKPIRPIVLMRHLAQFKLGRIGSEAFKFPQNSKGNKNIEMYSSKYVFGDKILYEYGLVNLAYRTAYNQYVSKGGCKHNLEILAQCAWANGEMELALKYDRLLSQMLFPMKRIVNIDEIRSLIPPTNRFEESPWLDTMLVNGFLERDFDVLPDNVQDLPLFYVLLRKDMKTFRNHCERLFAQREKWKLPRHLPTHFQEAVLITSNNIAADIKKFALLPEIVAKYEKFRILAQHPGEAKQLQKEFGDTYWFFFIQKEDLNVY